MEKPISVCVLGAAGRLGRLTVKLIMQDPHFTLVGAIEHSNSNLLGQDAGLIAGMAHAGIAVTSDMQVAITSAQVVIDFTAPPAINDVVEICVQHNVAYIVATTALNQEHLAVLAQAGKTIPVLQAANFSVGVYALTSLLKQATEILKNKGFQCEIFELHHNHKKDSPSGTAWQLANTIVDQGFAQEIVTDRNQRTEARTPDSVGVVGLRAGDVVGEHTVFFAGEHERIEITHRATSLEVFPKGALLVAAWLIEQPAKLYTMNDYFIGSKE